MSGQLLPNPQYNILWILYIAAYYTAISIIHNIISSVFHYGLLDWQRNSLEVIIMPASLNNHILYSVILYTILLRSYLQMPYLVYSTTIQYYLSLPWR